MPTRHPTPPRLAFLIGGSEGIGLATARALAARGTSVVLFGRSPAKLEAALSSLGTAGARPTPSTSATVQAPRRSSARPWRSTASRSSSS